MMKISALTAIILIAAFSLEAKKIAGKIIFHKDTVDVTFNIPIKFFSGEPNYQKLQYKVRYFDAKGNKITLRPDDAKEIRFQHNGEIVRMLSRRNTLESGNIFSTSSNIFLRLEIDGRLKMFSYYYTQGSPGMYNPSTGMTTGGGSYETEKYVLQNGNEELKWPRGLSFRKDMMEYFANCPALVKKIEDREFRKNEIESIVLFYNTHCVK